MSAWAVRWAKEVLPISALAHDQLVFKVSRNGRTWNAKIGPDVTPQEYDQWAARIVTAEIQRAGYRLAAVVEKVWPN